jgi:hypothetical protein
MVEADNQIDKPQEKFFEARPCSRLMYDALSVLEEDFVDSARLSDILYLAQECGVIEGDKNEIYSDFSPFGPEPNRPVSGRLALDIFYLQDKGLIPWTIGSKIVGPEERRKSVQAQMPDQLGVIQNPKLLKEIGLIEPIHLMQMVKAVIRRDIPQERNRELLSEFEDICEQVKLINQLREIGVNSVLPGLNEQKRWAWLLDWVDFKLRPSEAVVEFNMKGKKEISGILLQLNKQARLKVGMTDLQDVEFFDGSLAASVVYSALEESRLIFAGGMGESAVKAIFFRGGGLAIHLG